MAFETGLNFTEYKLPVLNNALCFLLWDNVALNILNLAVAFPVQIKALENELTEKDEAKKEAYYKKFRLWHGISMIGNFASLGINSFLVIQRILRS